MYRIEQYDAAGWVEVAAYQDIRSAKAQFNKLANANLDKKYRRIAVHEVYEGVANPQPATEDPGY